MLKSKMTNLRDGEKIFVIVGVVMASILGMGAYNLASMNMIATETAEIAELDIPLTESVTLITVNQLEQAINFERALRHAQVAEWAEYDHAKEAFHTHGTMVDEEFIKAEHMAEEAITLASTDAAKQEFAHVLEVLTKIDKEHLEYEDHVDHIFSLVESNQMDSAHDEIVLTEELEEKIDHEIEALLFELEHFTQASLVIVEKHGEDAVIFIIVIVVTVLATCGVALLFTKKLDGLLQKVTKATEKVAGGDLAIKSEELGDKNSSLVKAFDSMLTNLKTLITEVKVTAGNVSKDANSVAASTEELNSGVEQVSSTVQQISTGSQSQASDLSDAKSIVDSVTNNTEGASASEKMAKIVELTKDSSEKVRGLAEKSAKITDVVEVIRGIAEKTNLLALNAAIEAARAGESGRGFAVVADEVRRLAEGSAKSSQEIDDLLREIQDEIKSTVTGIDESAKEVEVGRDVVEKSLHALENIGKKVQEISAVSEQNAAASEQASASVEQQTAATEDISTSSQSMASLAGDLERKVAQFKLQESNDNNFTTQDTSSLKPQKKSFKDRILKKEESIDDLVQTVEED